MASQYVILDGSDKDNRVQVAVHTDVPATGTNFVGTQWQTAVAGYVNGKPSVVPAVILPANRQTELDSGTRYEWTFSMEFDANLADAAKQAAVESEITALEPTKVAELQNVLKFWGQTGAVS